MKKVLKNLYRTPFDFPFGKKEKGLSCKSEAWLFLSSFGNTLFYSFKYIEDHFDFITQKGGLAFQMLNHRHEASSCSDRVFEKFQAPRK